MVLGLLLSGNISFASLEDYQDFINKTPGYKFYIWAQPKDLDEGGMYSADNNRYNAIKIAIGACNQKNIDCIVAYENGKFVKEDSIVNYYVERCEKFGFKRNTEKIASCALDLYKSENRSNDKNSSENKSNDKNSQVSEKKITNIDDIEKKINRNSEILEKLNDVENSRTTNHQLRVACKLMGACK